LPRRLGCSGLLAAGTLSSAATTTASVRRVTLAAISLLDAALALVLAVALRSATVAVLAVAVLLALGDVCLKRVSGIPLVLEIGSPVARHG
jgi:hypothetical protein